MDERRYEGPLPAARSVAGGAPPLPDGDRVPCPARPDRRALSRREYGYGVTMAVVVLVLFVLGIFG
ncbi:hypothetical protein [Micromonospora sp. SH-82]|uniref:hypothetical protein n=1 Tax=Micromonospora sp. SH-82 TaxID=3132938 RepID=UPI003EBA037F